MQRIFGSGLAWDLHGVAATRQIEREAGAGLPAHTLMQRAGLAVAQLALAVAPHAQRIAVACGPGNNGGDGLEAALHLHVAGKQVEVALIGDPALLPPDAAASLARARAAGLTIHAGVGTWRLAADDLAIDALLGLGASRAPDGDIAESVRRLQGSGAPVLAIDLPSGLDVATGQPFGAHGVRARHTLSLLTLKPGLFTAAARDRVGEVWFDDLGVVANAHAAPDARLAGRPAPRQRDHAQHKGSFGDLAVVGGAPGMRGAALLAARAGYAAGAGRVFVQCLGEAAPELDLLRPELMFRSDLLSERSRATALACIVCGCGGGDAVRAVLPAVMASAPRLVLDADGLNAVASETSLQTLLRARASSGRCTVLTPHPLEAARLLGVPTAQVQADRLASATELAARYACTVLLKGSGSIVAAPGRLPSVNPTGNAALATAGTGDVLAGWLGGVWSGRPVADGFDVAVHSAYLHGACADAQPHAPLRAADLAEALYRQHAG
jgi:hydroxyethylthiazole kinase-like uncharacterized protein yjeF